jgi:peptidyl-prolyl cis-trans isomerase SurA
MRRKLLTSVALVGSLIGLSACGAADSEPTTASTAGASASQGAQAQQDPQAQQEGGTQDAQAQGQDEAGASQPAMPEPDLEGIPDVVATVNGEEISGKDFSGVYESQFQQMAMQAQMSGQELDQEALKEQTLDSMVGSELLVQDAEANGHEATDQDVDALLEETVKAQQLGSVDELMAAYKERGFAEEQVRSDARKQVLMTAAIEEIDIPEPTEAELKELYDQAAAAQPPAQGGEGGEGSGQDASAQTPSYEELKPQLEQQVTAQKQNEAIMKRMEQLRQDADVEVRL